MTENCTAFGGKCPNDHDTDDRCSLCELPTIEFVDCSVQVDFPSKQPKGVSVKKKWEYRRERLQSLQLWKRWKRDGTLDRVAKMAIRQIELESCKG